MHDFCTRALDLVVIYALLREILLRVLGPAELLIVLADVEDLENRLSIRTGELDRNLPVNSHAIAVFLVDRRAENRAVANEKAAPRSSRFRFRSLGTSAVGLVGLVRLVVFAGLLLLARRRLVGLFVVLEVLLGLIGLKTH